MVVHCSAGIGRTGAFIAMDHAVASLEKTAKVNIVEIIDDIRHDRCAMVQHNQQYDLVWESTIRYAELEKHAFCIAGDEPEVEKRLTSQEMAALRAEEKKAAAARSKNHKLHRPMSKSQLQGELRLDTLAYAGKVFEFLDVDGDGGMDFREARMQGMTKEVFDTIDADGNGTITGKGQLAEFLILISTCVVQEFKAFIMKQQS